MISTELEQILLYWVVPSLTCLFIAIQTGWFLKEPMDLWNGDQWAWVILLCTIWPVGVLLVLFFFVFILIVEIKTVLNKKYNFPTIKSILLKKVF